jgi:hypothetical protein
MEALELLLHQINGAAVVVAHLKLVEMGLLEIEELVVMDQLLL